MKKILLAFLPLNSLICPLLLIGSLVLNFSAHGQIITTIAGNGHNGASSDGELADTAQFFGPGSIATDGNGNIYFADAHRIRKVNALTGILTTIAGSNAGFLGDGGLATLAELNFPEGIAFDTSGNVYIADWGNNRIRKITASNGFITTIAGNGTVGYTGNGGAATSATLHNPSSITVDAKGNVYFVDAGNNVVRKITASTGFITSVAGNGYCGCAGYTSDGGMADTTRLNYPSGIAVNSLGDVFIADKSNSRIRKVTAATGIISTIAGTGMIGYSGDGGMADTAKLFEPSGIFIEPNGDLYFSDVLNVIRKITANTGIITTIAGDTTKGFSGDGGLATLAELNQPIGVTLDPSGNVFIADQGNYRIRKVKLGASGIHNISSNEDVIIYPVPNNGLMNLRLNGSNYTAIKIYSEIGIEIYSHSLDKDDLQQNVIINIMGLSNGVYFLQAISSIDTIIKRIVIEQ